MMALLRTCAFLLILGMITPSMMAQVVPIVNYTINANGQAEIEVSSTSQNYYVLEVRHHIDSPFVHSASMTLGSAFSTIISEPLGNYPVEHYQVLEHPNSSPVDTDDDGIDDMTEYQNMPDQSPLNAAFSVDIEDGAVMVDDFASFKDLSVKKDLVQWSEFLNGKEYLKYTIVDFFTDPKIFFINTRKYNLHSEFANAIGVAPNGDNVKKGQVMYHPASVSNNGTLGAFAFNYSNGIPQDFEVVQKTQELLAANLPFLENNLAYFITTNNQQQYSLDSISYINSRIPILLESEVYADVDYLGLNPAEGYGFFRLVPLDEIPGPRDIVLYESLPNSLPRVGGIITSVIQTPLSHVNLRAIQNNIPNAFIRDPLFIEDISSLLDDYIYFKVEQESYTIRKATVEEVNAWYEASRPDEEQNPPLNLDHTSILNLDDIDFSMSDGFGAKCANVATMRTFGFPEGTIPDGYGVPFYFYQEFMEYNDFFSDVDALISHPDFLSDRNIRDEMLNTFRDKIKDAEMPAWMMTELEEMHLSFPLGTSIRCRSSSNNEDLEGFNGAGLYTSKTQHPHEGHISKSIKQVYASLWNLRAFEERDFYRINHYQTSMGVLCHPNYSDEKVNGVGVSTDPIYNTKSTFYLNSQIGEDLITNPENNSIPEEILLYRSIGGGNGYVVIQPSSLASSDSLLMGESYLDEMREFLSVIHDEFAILYESIDNSSFAMDIEYKITSEDQLIIKQARPWVSYSLNSEYEMCSEDGINIIIYPNPARRIITVHCEDCVPSYLIITSIKGEVVHQEIAQELTSNSTSIDIQSLPEGIYTLSLLNSNNEHCHSTKFVKSK